MKINYKFIILSSFVALSAFMLAYFFSNQAQKSEFLQAASTFNAYVSPLHKFFYSKLNGRSFDFSQLHDNIRERYYFMDGSIELYKQSPFLGAGAGAHLGSTVLIDGHSIALRHIHNYWLEIFIQFGFVVLGLYLYWIFSTVYRVQKTPYAHSVVLFFVGAPVLSSAVYFLPIWLICGIAQFEAEKAQGVTTSPSLLGR